MIDFLSDQPFLMLMTTCCLWPGVVGVIGFLLGRYRPRFRAPFTVDRRDHEEF